MDSVNAVGHYAQQNLQAAIQSDNPYAPFRAGQVVPVEKKRDHRCEPTPAANPKQLYGDRKPPLHLIHSIAKLHESAALHSGRRKYGENNYLQTAVEAMTYVGAIQRHLDQWTSGERVDSKELVHHLGAIRACTTILLTAEATGMLIDNRPCVGPVEANCYPGPQSYQQATEDTFAEVERTIEHLNALYPPKE